MVLLTYWLIPAEPARSYFAALISDLATRFDAPVFEPHLTVYVTKPGNKDAGESLKRVPTDWRAYRLSISGVGYSDEFTKTLFVRFQPNEELTRLSANLRCASAFQSEYELNPHLSLIYKSLSRQTKTEIASSLSLAFDEVLFDSVKTVVSPAEVKSREDVEAWRVVASQLLTG